MQSFSTHTQNKITSVSGHMNNKGFDIEVFLKEIGIYKHNHPPPKKLRVRNRGENLMKNLFLIMLFLSFALMDKEIRPQNKNSRRKLPQVAR